MLILQTQNKNPESRRIPPYGMDVKPFVSKGNYFMEIWKDIIGFENRYQISNLGRLKGIKLSREVIKKLSTTHNGYSQSVLYGKLRRNVRIHKLVAEAFIPNPYNKPYINHINGIKKDNRVENLEWVTHSENLKHAYQNGLMKPQKGKDNRRSTPVLKLDLYGNVIDRYEGVREAGRENGCAMSSIQKCCADSNKQLYGYKYKLA